MIDVENSESDISESTLDTLNSKETTPIVVEAGSGGGGSSGSGVVKVGKGTLLMDHLQQQQKDNMEGQQKGNNKKHTATAPPPTPHNSLLMSQKTLPMTGSNPNIGLRSVMLGAFATSSSKETSQHQPDRQQQQQPPQQQQQQQAGMPPVLSRSGMAQHTDLASYGAIISGAEPQEPSRGMFLNDPGFEQQQQQQREHDFAYSHPDAMMDDNPSQERITLWRRLSGCCCFLNPMWACLQSDTLCRSFCFGGIDGMSTGAGILAAFWGTGLLSITSSPIPLRIFVVAFTAATCIADALCLAWGHVWTTRTWATTHANERATAKHDFLHYTSQAKQQLVEQLLQKGMLKIDAMSLADTLEGYPDLFASALIGDALTTTTTAAQSDSSTTDPKGGGGGGGGDPYGMRSIPSYNQYHDLMDMEDPETQSIRLALSEAARESICMMFGFAIFALVPSGVALSLSYLTPYQDDLESETFNYHLHRRQQELSSGAGGSSSLNDDSTEEDADIIQPETLFVFVLCLIMAVLGVWKSRFVGGGGGGGGDTNNSPAMHYINNTTSPRPQLGALVFALEAIAVLLLCLGSGYGMGWILTSPWGFAKPFELQRLPG